MSDEEYQEPTLCMKLTHAFFTLGCCCLCCFCSCSGIIATIAALVPCYDNLREDFNARNGVVSEHLNRQVITARSDYDEVLLKQNMWYYNEPALNWTSCEIEQYWPETGMAEIS